MPPANSAPHRPGSSGIDSAASRGRPCRCACSLARRCFWIFVFGIAVAPASGQLAPEIGYVFPAGGRAGETIEVLLGGYDWTSDVDLLPHDAGVSIAVTGPASPVLIPDPPHLFGFKARANDRPCPREFPARVTIPPGLAPGLHRFQVANANGASPPGFFHVSPHPAIVEARVGAATQELPALPLVIDGRLGRNEEIDRYAFTAPAAGPVWIDVVARRLLSPLHATLRVIDSAGKVLLDVADTAGRDVSAAFVARAGERYRLELGDVDHGGDRSSVYRVELASGPRVLATLPAAATRGSTARVGFRGGALVSDGLDESVEREIVFPAEGDLHEVRIDTPAGVVTAMIPLTGIAERVADGSEGRLAAPVGASGVFAEGRLSHVLDVDLPAGRWRVAAAGTCPGHPLDLRLAILGADGREVASVDDVDGSLDPAATVTVADAGPHRIVVEASAAGSASIGPAAWRVAIEPEVEAFDPALALATQVSVPLGGSTKVPVAIRRSGGFAGPVAVAFRDLPDGVTAPAGIAIAAGAADTAVELACAADAGTSASLATVVLTGTTAAGGTVLHQRRVAVAPTMKPRVKIVPDGLDDVRKVHRGTTFRGPLTIRRLEGYEGPVRLEPTAKQQRHRQGMDGGEMEVPAGATRADYPVFVPEWMETTRTSRFIVNGAVDVADPRGRPRTLLERQELRLGMLPVGAVMKLSAPAEAVVRPGGVVEVPVSLVRGAEFRALGVEGPVTLGLGRVEPTEAGALRGEAAPAIGCDEVLLPRNDLDDEEAVVRLALPPEAATGREWRVTLRATALEAGRHRIVSESVVTLVVE